MIKCQPDARESSVFPAGFAVFYFFFRSSSRSSGSSFVPFSSFGNQPPDKGPEEPTKVIRLRPEEEEKTDNREMYVDAKKRKSVDVEITLLINCPDLRKLERIMEVIANI